MPLFTTPGQLVQRAELYHQVGQLTAAGIPLLQALEMQQRHPSQRAAQPHLIHLSRRLDQGATFAEALNSTGTWMPAFDRALLHAGELSGRLPACFQLLSQYYHERARLARSLIGYLAYPAFILHLGLLIFPVSQLQALVLQGNLAGYVIQKLALLLPLYAIMLVTASAFQGTRGEAWRALMESLLRRLPLIGTARHQLALARLAASLEALVAAGIPLIEAWELAAAASGSPALTRAVGQYKSRLYEGMTPAEMVRQSGEFPPEFASLYHTGEISGQLEESLQRLSRYYQQEGFRKMKTFLIAVAAGVIALVMLLAAWQVIAFWLDYFRQIQEVMPN